MILGISDEYSSSKIAKALSLRSEYTVVHIKDVKESLASVTHGLLWLEYEDIPFDSLVSNLDTLMANSYCIRKGLIRKSQMAYVIHKHLSKHDGCILKSAIPETYLFELDDPYYFEEAMNEVFEVAAELRENESIDDARLRKRWILKPSITNKGAEIFIFDTEDQLRAMFEERYERQCEQEEASGDEDGDGAGASSQGNLAHIREWVMQRYLANPLCLFGGRKFHIRTYVLAVGNIRVFVFREMLALFAGEPYDVEDLSARCHITNTCVQVEDSSFAESDLVKRFWALEGEMSREQLDSVFEQVKAVVSEVFVSVAHEVTVFQPMRNMFELYGLDFLVDSDMRVHFLEANAFPDFRQTGAELSGIIDALFEQTIAVALDPFFGIAAPPARDMHLVLDVALRGRT